MDAAAGAHVERAPDAAARREEVAQPRGRRVRRDVVRGILGVLREAVRGEQQLPDRDDATARDDLACAYFPESGRLERREPGGTEGALRLALRRRELQEEKSHRAGEPGGGEPPLLHGDCCRAAAVAVLAEQLGDLVLDVPDLAQRGAEPARGGSVGDREGRFRHGTDHAGSGLPCAP